MMKFLLVIISGFLLVLVFRANFIMGIIASLLFIAVGIHKSIPSIYKLKSRKAFADGDFISAKNILKKVADKPDAPFDLKMEYAYTLIRAGEFENAERIFNNIPSGKVDYSSRARVIIQRCLCYYKMGNLEEAYNDASELFDEGYKSMSLYGLLGYFKILKDPKSPETFNFCTEAYEYADDDRDICDNMLICYYNRGEYFKAKEISDKVLSANPKFVEAWYHAAQIDYAMGNYEMAKEKLGLISECNRSHMTTVPEEAVIELVNEVNNRLEVRENC